MSRAVENKRVGILNQTALKATDRQATAEYVTLFFELKVRTTNAYPKCHSEGLRRHSRIIVFSIRVPQQGIIETFIPDLHHTGISVFRGLQRPSTDKEISWRGRTSRMGFDVVNWASNMTIDNHDLPHRMHVQDEMKTEQMSYHTLQLPPVINGMCPS